MSVDRALNHIDRGIELAYLPDGCHSTIYDLYEYWRSIKPSGEALPGRQHLDPTDIPKLPPHLWIVDVERSAEEYRYRHRIHGTRLGPSSDGTLPANIWTFRPGTGVRSSSRRFSPPSSSVESRLPGAEVPLC
jgi:hypothetical protein